MNKSRNKKIKEREYFVKLYFRVTYPQVKELRPSYNNLLFVGCYFSFLLTFILFCVKRVGEHTLITHKTSPTSPYTWRERA